VFFLQRQSLLLHNSCLDTIIMTLTTPSHYYYDKRIWKRILTPEEERERTGKALGLNSGYLTKDGFFLTLSSASDILYCVQDISG
jgi:hypothetical protein